MKNEPESRADSPVEFSRHKLLLDVIRQFNKEKDTEKLISRVLRAVQARTGIEAIAMRFKNGNDYTFYSSVGFPDKFIESENSLFVQPENEEGSTSGPGLECICGMVAEGCGTDMYPCFTGNGSFCINASDDPSFITLLETCTKKIRKRCIAEGYQSIAIIPIKADKAILGLVQFNDKRKNIFTPDIIDFLESCCFALGGALLRKSIESGMFQTNRNLESIIEERTTELLKTIRDREKLLDEVNHRIKNNLLIISSLLNLQVMKETNTGVRSALNGALMRIDSMGIIHHSLYSSSDLERIAIEEYISALYNRILYTYGIKPGVTEFSLDCRGINVNIDTAIPCGLIINEILSNSVRHGITEGNKLQISVSIWEEGSSYRILINDNGPGLPAGFIPDQDGLLGMELIRSLVKQLDGSMEVYNSDGLTLDIRICGEDKEEKRWRKKKS